MVISQFMTDFEYKIQQMVKHQLKLLFYQFLI